MHSAPVRMEEYRDQLDSQYQAPAWHSGIPATEAALAIRRIYSRSELQGVPYVLTKARMLSCAMESMRVAYNDFDSFATVCESCYEIAVIADERRNILSEQALGPVEWRRKCEAEASGSYTSTVDLSHTSPDWDAILTLGLPGLLQRAEQKHREAPSPFYEAVILTFRAWKTLLTRLAAAARAAGREDVAHMTEAIIDHAPQTLQQALELAWTYRELQETEGELVRSMGIFDRLFLPFYEHDIAAGLLTPESAENLLAVYFSRCHAQSKGRSAGVHFCFGGLLPDGTTDGCNALTRIALKAFRRVGKVDPKFSLRVNAQTPPEVMELALSCVRDGQSAILFIHEEMVRKALLRNGKDASDLVNFVPIGCYEPSIMGKELCCSMTGMINMAKALEELMSPSFSPKDFGEVLARFLEILRQRLQTMMDRINVLEHQWSRINPTPALSGTMQECMDRALDATAGGAKYAASGIMCAGIGTVADSLAAIQYLVFDEKKLSFGEFADILRKNWKGHERLRLIAAKRAPKWGNNDDRADSLARIVADAVADTIENHPNDKGGHFQMGLWSIDRCLDYGRKTGATPDGRRAGDVLSKNTGSTIGCDAEGPAGLIESVTKLDYSRFADGSVCDMMLPSSSVKGGTGLAFMENLFRVFCAKGGAFMHFNVLSVQELREAQKAPEQHRNLQIRLCGWNVRFIDLEKEIQDCIIQEAQSKEA